MERNSSILIFGGGNVTDNDIKKALECCKAHDFIMCPNDCPLLIDEQCSLTMSAEALNLINRQQAEIERLKAEADMADGSAEALIQTSKTEAIKEFERKIKAHAYYIDVPKEHRVVDEDDIDTVLRDMTESVNYGSSKTEE